MPLRGRGAFPAAPASHRDDTADQGSGGGAGPGAKSRPCIAEYRAMKQLPRYQDALALLRRVGGIVQPIMALRGWHLPLLVEIYPAKENLLGFNVNAGRKIALRLRRPHDKDDFYDEESVVETMLHELAHNLRGPHDEIFARHLDELTHQWQEMRAGHWLPGQGFLTPGQVLGTSSSANRGETLRHRSKRAAENRVRNQALGGGAYTLGEPDSSSHSLLQHLSPREAALIAAERRRAISNACPSNDVASTQVAAQEQEDDEIKHGIVVITINDDDDDEEVGLIENQGLTGAKRQKQMSRSPSVSRCPPSDASRISVSDESDDDDLVIIDCKRRSEPTSSKRPQAQPRALQQMRAAANLRSGLMAHDGDAASLRGRLEPSGRLSSRDGTHSLAQRRAWTCQTCTLSNASHALQCAACEAVRPGVPWWTCAACGRVMLDQQADFWCCISCGRMKIA